MEIDDQSRALHIRGPQLLKAGDYEGAVMAFTEAISLSLAINKFSINKFSAYQRRAQALQYLDRNEEAETDLQNYRSEFLAESPGRRFMAIMCRIGWHHGVCWVFQSPKTCVGFRICLRCGTKVTSVRHDPGWQYVAPKNCYQKRICRRCSALLGYTTEHAWGELVGELYHCSRCGEKG